MSVLSHSIKEQLAAVFILYWFHFPLSLIIFVLPSKHFVQVKTHASKTSQLKQQSWCLKITKHWNDEDIKVLKRPIECPKNSRIQSMQLWLIICKFHASFLSGNEDINARTRKHLFLTVNFIYFWCCFHVSIISENTSITGLRKKE